MWWDDVRTLAQRLSSELSADGPAIAADAHIEPGAVLDDRAGPIHVGSRTRICAGAIVRGPVVIGEDCMIGNQVLVRGPVRIGNAVRIGFSTEIKQSLVADGVSIGPMCFVSDSRIDAGAYLGALVRTSNQRLDLQPVTVREDGCTVETGLDKLGCWIGAGVSLGIQVIVLPGRVIASGSLFEPRITIDRNYPSGHYRVQQNLERVTARV